ncbi:hypothetical protein Moror_7597 [Moniliophthora roreri MCA 2997]|uniref:Uncharacterized protein n=2 Tax=Moniliophthora roreri TaxID=221103 RepID=V2WTJ7_MONRO|nr:hypothetical protein Moror_7597 [Moniliophthora roreri MCA 2997]KAI3615339.1 hypothetical protein WG66_003440 [Moniliophthora roreri]
MADSTGESRSKPTAHTQAQPSAKPPMNDRPDLGRLASEKYVEKVAEGAADKTVEYATEDPQQRADEAQQRIDEAKEQARGMWAKYCGCFGSA